jgi:hypothetical protein
MADEARGPRGEEATNEPISGAVDINECRTRRPMSRYVTCQCEPKCVVCGFGKHTAVHGPLLGYPTGSRPWGHVYTPPTGPKEAADG